MRTAYHATNPDSHVARNKSLLNDCVKANFNARQLDFDQAMKICDCTVAAVHTVPHDEFDQWFALVQLNPSTSMQEQRWYPELLPKLQACTTQ